MVFNSIDYAIFLPVVLALYWFLRHREQNIMLLVASYIFYGAWDYRFLGLMMISTATDYTVGMMLGRTEDDRKRKRIFLVSLCVNLGILGFFKYFNFFSDSAASLLNRFGLHLDAPTLRVLLPIGISFYTFHGISYTFDIYRRRVAPTRDLISFALFIAYFPQLVAGPIGRAQVQLPQFEAPRKRASWEQIRSGVFLILLGLFKKIAIADALAPYVNQTFGHTTTAGAGHLLVGAYAFTLQIYGDFSGYSDIARGSSRLFGIELLRNFDQPFLSRNITEFWRTWHVSLSTWLRDYLYLPLGGNRGSRFATYRNLFITMFLAGLWHGARWTFVAFGAFHGIMLALHRVFSGRDGDASPIGGPVGTLPIGPGTPGEGEASTRTLPAVATDTSAKLRGWAPPKVAWGDLLPIVATLQLVVIGFVFFRANTLHQAFAYLGGIATLRAGPIPTDALATLLAATVAIFFVDLVQRDGGGETAMLAWPPLARGLAFGAFLVAILVFSGGAPVPFIYFQF